MKRMHARQQASHEEATVRSTAGPGPLQRQVNTSPRQSAQQQRLAQLGPVCVQGKFVLKGMPLPGRRLNPIERWVEKYHSDKLAEFRLKKSSDGDGEDIDKWLRLNFHESYEAIRNADVSWEDNEDREYAEDALFDEPQEQPTSTLAYGEESVRGALAELRKHPHMTRKRSRYVASTPGGKWPEDSEATQARNEFEARGGSLRTRMDVLEPLTGTPAYTDLRFRYPRTNRGTSPSTGEIVSAFVKRVGEVGRGELSIPRPSMYDHGTLSSTDASSLLTSDEGTRTSRRSGGQRTTPTLPTTVITPMAIGSESAQSETPIPTPSTYHSGARRSERSRRSDSSTDASSLLTSGEGTGTSRRSGGQRTTPTPPTTVITPMAIGIESAQSETPIPTPSTYHSGTRRSERSRRSNSSTDAGSLLTSNEGARTSRRSGGQRATPTLPTTVITPMTVGIGSAQSETPIPTPSTYHSGTRRSERSRRSNSSTDAGSLLTSDEGARTSRHSGGQRATPTPPTTVITSNESRKQRTPAGVRNSFYASKKFEAAMKRQGLAISSVRPGPEAIGELGDFGYTHRMTDKADERTGGVTGKTFVINREPGPTSMNTGD